MFSVLGFLDKMLTNSMQHRVDSMNSARGSPNEAWPMSGWYKLIYVIIYPLLWTNLDVDTQVCPENK